MKTNRNSSSYQYSLRGAVEVILLASLILGILVLIIYSLNK